MNTRKRIFPGLTFGAGALALLATGCGDGVSIEVTTPTPLATTATADDGTTAPPVASPTPTATVYVHPDVHAARESLRAGRYTEAAAVFDAVARNESEPLVKADAWLGAGVARYQAGDLDGALVDLQAASTAGGSSPVGRRAAYLYGLRLLEAGRPGDAADAVQPHVEQPADDLLRPFIGSVYASALAADGRADLASDVWDDVIADPYATDDLLAAVYRERADVALDSGDPASAADWLGRVAALSPTAALRYELASLAESFDDSATYVGQLNAIIYDSPATSWAARAVEDLMSSGQSVDLGQAGYVQYRSRNYSEARRLLTLSLEEPAISESARAFRTYYLAAAYEDDGLPGEAVPIYDRVVANFPASEYAHRAAYWAARATERTGDAAAASDRYVALATASANGEFTEEAAFRAGFVLLADDNPAGALAAWDAAPVRSDDRLLYWRGRALEALGDEDAARTAFETAADGDRGFYGQAAAIRMGAPVPTGRFQPVDAPAPIDWDEIAEWVSGTPGQAAPPTPQTPAAELALLGLRREATSVLSQQAADTSGMDRLAYIRAAYDAGLVHLSARWATALASGADDAPDDLMRLAYPLDYVEYILEAGEQYDVDPLFLAALIRQESFWDSSAVSFANAIGLTQVIPPTGESIASALGMNGWTTADLTRPAVSIEFGAFYIAGQLDRFGDPHHALAAYNGGPGNAARWARETPTGDPADYVETINLSETRGYVVAVMEHYARYQELYR